MKTGRKKLEYIKQWGKRNLEKVLGYQKKYKENNVEKVALSKKKWREENKGYFKEYRDKNKEKIALGKKIYRKENLEKVKIQQKKSYERNRTKKLEYQKKYAKENKEKIRDYKKEYCGKNRAKINKYVSDKRKIYPKLKLDGNMGSLILKSLGKEKRSRRWELLVGYTVEQLMEHLEKQFKPEMTWENHGPYWHLDHIKPKCLFKYKTAEEQEFKECWGLNNLQPLEAKENLRKNNKYLIRI